MFWIALTIITLASLLGVVLTFLTLPGTWIMLGVAALCWAWQTGLYNPWVFVAALALAILAEVAEFLASAAGSAKAGGSKAGAIGSIVGSLVGLFVGQIVIPIPLIGAIIGAVIGAGAGALLLEKGISKRTWTDSWRSGRGAATGRALSIVIKGGFAIVIAMVLILGALFGPGPVVPDDLDGSTTPERGSAQEVLPEPGAPQADAGQGDADQDPTDSVILGVPADPADQP